MKEKFGFLIVWLLCLTACSSDKGNVVDLQFTNDILLPHTSVRNQGRTQTCWAYTMASLVESDWLAKGQDTLRLSVMYQVRNKYMRQFEQYYYSKGNEEIRNGSLGHTYLQEWKQHGLIPLEVYKGVAPKSKYHDHRALLKCLKSLAENAVEEKNLSLYRSKVEDMLDEYMGKVPERFQYKGQNYTPVSFAESLRLDADRYVELTSFMHHPFYSEFVLEIPDNWEHAPFYNLPLDSLENCVKLALSKGQTVAWDGDTSENGFDYRQGVALYPQSSVTQEDRQQAFERFETTDDHMMHIVGTAYDEKNRFYYILKNSWGKTGPYKGLIYMSQAYFRAKTISVVIPRYYVSAIK